MHYKPNIKTKPVKTRPNSYRSNQQFIIKTFQSHDLGETPAKCAVRECKEETGYKISISRLLGAWSSNCYEYLNYPWKNNEFCHLVFEGVVIGGDAEISAETIKVGWFKENQLPELSDGHLTRILFGFKAKKKGFEAYYE